MQSRAANGPMAHPAAISAMRVLARGTKKVRRTMSRTAMAQAPTAHGILSRAMVGRPIGSGPMDRRQFREYSWRLSSRDVGFYHAHMTPEPNLKGDVAIVTGA